MQCGTCGLKHIHVTRWTFSYACQQQLRFTTIFILTVAAKRRSIIWQKCLAGVILNILDHEHVKPETAVLYWHNFQNILYKNIDNTLMYCQYVWSYEILKAKEF